LNDEPQLLKVKFNKLFDQAMIQALKDNYEAPLITNKQIIISWERVRQRLNEETSNSSCQD
jgi:hypothetical protein